MFHFHPLAVSVLYCNNSSEMAFDLVSTQKAVPSLGPFRNVLYIYQDPPDFFIFTDLFGLIPIYMY